MAWLADDGKNAFIREAMADFQWLDLDGLMVRPAVFHQLTVTAKRTQVWHTHPWWEWTLVRSGENRYREKGKGFLPRKAGASFFMPSGVLHAWEPVRFPLLLDGFLLELFPLTAHGAASLENLRASAQSRGFRLDLEFGESFFREVDGEAGGKPRFAARRLRSLVSDFLIRLFREALPAAVAAAPVEKGTRSRLFIVAKDWIDRNLERDPSLSEVGAALGVTPRNLNRIFGEVLGLPCGKYIQERKLMQGYHLLQTDPAMRVREVARRCGFDDPAYFTRAFTARFELSPTQARNRYLH